MIRAKEYAGRARELAREKRALQTDVEPGVLAPLLVERIGLATDWRRQRDGAGKIIPRLGPDQRVAVIRGKRHSCRGRATTYVPVASESLRTPSVPDGSGAAAGGWIMTGPYVMGPFYITAWGWNWEWAGSAQIHPGIIMSALADGSTRGYSVTVDYTIWQRINAMASNTTKGEW